MDGCQTGKMVKQNYGFPLANIEGEVHCKALFRLSENCIGIQK